MMKMRSDNNMTNQTDPVLAVDGQNRIDKTDYELLNIACEEGDNRDEFAPIFGEGILLAAQFRRYCGGKRSWPVRLRNRMNPRRSVALPALLWVVRFLGMAILGTLMVAAAVIAICLFGGFTLYGLIPPMPYWCGAVFGIASAALSILAGAGVLYPISFAGGRYRAIARNAFAMFCASFLGGMLASMLSSGAGGFWHAWGWFGYIV